MADSFAGLRPPKRRRLLRREPNPVLIKELRSRFRGPRAFVMLTAFLLMLSFFATFILFVTEDYSGWNAGPGYHSANYAAQVGQQLFNGIAMTQLVFLIFTAPALTMSSISGEIERQSYELLLATPLKPAAILFGKLGAAMAYVLLIVFSALPVMSLAFVFGGVTAGQVALTQLGMLIAGLLFCSVGLAASSVFKRTARSAASAYLGSAAICFGPMIALWISLILLSYRWGLEENLWILFSSASPLMSAVLTTWGSSDLSTEWWVFWIQSISVQLLLSSFFILIAHSRIRGARVPKKRLLLMLGLFVLWFGLSVIFGASF